MSHHLPLSHVQCAGTLSRGTEEAAAARHQENQHLHRDLPRVLCTLRHHQVSLTGGILTCGGWDRHGLWRAKQGPYDLEQSPASLSHTSLYVVHCGVRVNLTVLMRWKVHAFSL